MSNSFSRHRGVKERKNSEERGVDKRGDIMGTNGILTGRKYAKRRVGKNGTKTERNEIM